MGHTYQPIITIIMQTNNTASSHNKSRCKIFNKSGEGLARVFLVISFFWWRVVVFPSSRKLVPGHFLTSSLLNSYVTRGYARRCALERNVERNGRNGPRDQVGTGRIQICIDCSEPKTFSFSFLFSFTFSFSIVSQKFSNIAIFL